MVCCQKKTPIGAFLLLLAAIWLPGRVAAARAAGEALDIEQLVSQAYQALEAGDLETASRQFNEALTASPGHAAALLGLAAVHERRGELPDALRLARLGAYYAPDSAVAVAAVGRLLGRLGATTEALDDLARARQLDPEAVDLYLLSAILLREQGRRREAIALLEEARSRGLGGEPLAAELILLLLGTGRPDDALRLATQAVEQDSQSARLHLALGLALATDATNRDEAVGQLETALSLGISEAGRVHLELGKLLLDTDRPADALAHLEQAGELLPESGEVFYRLAAAQRAQGDAAGAAESLARFQELNRRHERQGREALEVGTALNRAQELAGQNRLPEALDLVDGLLLEHPEEARVHTLRGKLLFSLERQEEALASVARARQLTPGRAEPHYLEGLFLMHLGRPAEAEAALSRAVALDPELGLAHLLLGGAAAKLERPGDAADHFERALQLGVDTPALRLGYAAALDSLGRPGESERQIEAYRRLADEPE